MIEAIYSAEFLSNNDKFGAGILVLVEGKVYGADQHYAYKGEYYLANQSLSASPQVEARVIVDKYSKEPLLHVGLAHFRLLLCGKPDHHHFTLSGAVDGKPDHMLTIQLTKISDLADH